MAYNGRSMGRGRRRSRRGGDEVLVQTMARALLFPALLIYLELVYIGVIREPVSRRHFQGAEAVVGLENGFGNHLSIGRYIYKKLKDYPLTAGGQMIKVG